MYSKYEEMQVMRQVIQNYADNQKMNYESEVALLKEKADKLDINSELGSLQRDVGSLSVIQTNYQSALSIVSELNKAIRCYEQAYTPEQLQPGGIAEERAKEGNRIFHDIRTQNPEYKRIMDEVSNELFKSHDYHIEDLGLDFDAKVESLEKDFEAGKLNKEQLIYYTNVCWTLSQNPQYIEYMNQLQQERIHDTKDQIPDIIVLLRNTLYICRSCRMVAHITSAVSFRTTPILLCLLLRHLYSCLFTPPTFFKRIFLIHLGNIHINIDFG